MNKTQEKKLLQELEQKLKESMTCEIVPQQFRDTRTGEIVTQFNIFDIEFMEKVTK